MSGSSSRRAFRAFQKVKTLRPSRSLFDLSHTRLFTGDAGKLYVSFAAEMSPGDTFHIWNEIVTRMQPLNAPILSRLTLNTHFFFVPYRILDDSFTELITGGIEGDKGGNTRGEDVDPDTVSPPIPRWRPSNTSVGSLWDSFGFPVGVVPEDALPVDYLRRAYNRIWNEYYRDENLQEEVSEDNENILYRNWKKDYFTSALLSQQRGVSPSMPVSGTLAPSSLDSKEYRMTGIGEMNTSIGRVSIEVRFSVPEGGLVSDSILPGFGAPIYLLYHDVGNTSLISRYLAYPEQARANHGSEFVVVYTYYGTIPSDETFDSVESGVYYSLYVNKGVDISDSSIGFDVKDLRQAFQIQKWLELANRGGVRYTEFLRSFFGVSPRDDRLQRPEYVGGTSSPIVVSEVLQTSSTVNEPTPQGYMAGHGIGASKTYVGSYSAVEYGVMIGLLSVMPDAMYSQGINRQWLRRSKFDFLFPQFTGLSEQAIEGAEIYATNNRVENRKVWGFNEIYDELRYMPSIISGKMRTVFNYWHLGRIFDSKPALNSDFIVCKPSKRIFAAHNEDGFIFNVGNIVRAVRPLPKYGTPRGV